MPSFSERWSNVVRNCRLDLTKPINIVSTSDIEKYGEWETRKMVSISSEKRQPEIFKQFGVFATPLSRVRVAIVKGKGFEKLEDITSPVQIHQTDFAFPASLRDSKGEANFLNYAFNCGVVGHFTGRPKLRSGFASRMRTYFTFRVDGLKPLKVQGAQIEIDGSFEDEANFYLAEAKYKTPESFNIRQLYYPFRAFHSKMQPRKVKCLFFAYEPGVDEYRFWEYVFRDPDDYEQIDLQRSARYKVAFTMNPLPLKQYEVQAVQMKAIQANDIFRLMDVPFAVADGIDDIHKLAFHFGFTPRQSTYYRDGMEILGFIARSGSKSVLTNEGEKYINLPIEQRTKFFVRRLVEYPPVSEIIHRLLSGEEIGEKELEEIVARHDATIHKSTIGRRADCLRNYFAFFADVMGYCKVKKGRILLVNARTTLNNYR